MSKFFNPASWYSAASDMLADVLYVAQALPELINDEFRRHDTTPAAVLGKAATQGAQALSATAQFAVVATGYLANGLVQYGPPVAKGVWYGFTHVGIPLAQGVGKGLIDYGPPVAMAVGKGLGWAGGQAWEAAKWGGNALAAAAEEHHVKERVLKVGQELLDSAVKGAGAVAQAGWESLSRGKADAGALPDTDNKALAPSESLPLGLEASDAAAVQERLSGEEAQMAALQDADTHALAQSESVPPGVHAGAALPSPPPLAADAPGKTPQAAPVPRLQLDGGEVLPTMHMSAARASETADDGAQAWSDSHDLATQLHSGAQAMEVEHGPLPGNAMAETAASPPTWQMGAQGHPGPHDGPGQGGMIGLVIFPVALMY